MTPLVTFKGFVISLTPSNFPSSTARCRLPFFVVSLFNGLSPKFVPFLPFNPCSAPTPLPLTTPSLIKYTRTYTFRLLSTLNSSLCLSTCMASTSPQSLDSTTQLRSLASSATSIIISPYSVTWHPSPLQTGLALLLIATLRFMRTPHPFTIATTGLLPTYHAPGLSHMPLCKTLTYRFTTLTCHTSCLVRLPSNTSLASALTTSHLPHTSLPNSPQPDSCSSVILGPGPVPPLISPPPPFPFVLISQRSSALPPFFLNFPHLLPGSLLLISPPLPMVILPLQFLRPSDVTKRNNCSSPSPLYRLPLPPPLFPPLSLRTPR